MNTYDKQYIRDCILNKKVIPPIIRKEIYIKLLELIESKKEIQQGLFIDNENLELELKEWFKEK